MGHKIDISEAITFSDDLTKTSQDIESKLKSVKSFIDQINAMDSFSGKAADSAKGYFNEFHLTVMESFEELFTDLDNNVKQHIEAFQSNVDSSESAIIESDYLTDHKNDIDIEYQNLKNMHRTIEKTIDEVSDISSASAPITHSITNDNREVVKTIDELEENLTSFTKEGKSHDSQTKELLNYIEVTMNKTSGREGEERFTTYNKDNTLDELKKLSDSGGTAAVGLTTSRTIYEAAKDQGLTATKYIKNGKVTYRINATEDALKKLGVTPDAHATRDFKKQKKNGKPKTALNYHDKNTGKQVNSQTGKDAVAKYPELVAFNDKATNPDKVKSVGNAFGKGFGNGIKDALDFKGIVSNGAKGALKVFAPLTAGLSYWDNYNDAQAEDLSGLDAHTRAAVDTTIDVSVSSAVQAGFTAAGTAFIPIPGVGTAIGAGVGILANMALNAKWGKGKKSVMDRTKDAFHKVKGWFS